MSINMATRSEAASAEKEVWVMAWGHSMFTNPTKEKGHGTCRHTRNLEAKPTHVGRQTFKII